MKTNFSGYGPQPRAWQGIVVTGLRGAAGTMRLMGQRATYAASLPTAHCSLPTTPWVIMLRSY